MIFEYKQQWKLIFLAIQISFYVCLFLLGFVNSR